MIRFDGLVVGRMRFDFDNRFRQVTVLSDRSFNDQDIFVDAFESFGRTLRCGDVFGLVDKIRQCFLGFAHHLFLAVRVGRLLGLLDKSFGDCG